MNLYIKNISTGVLFRTQRYSQSPAGFNIGLRSIIIPLLQERHINQVGTYIGNRFGGKIDQLPYNSFMEKYAGSQNLQNLLVGYQCFLIRPLAAIPARLIGLEDKEPPNITIYPTDGDHILVVRDRNGPETASKLESLSTDIFRSCFGGNSFSTRNIIRFMSDAPRGELW